MAIEISVNNKYFYGHFWRPTLQLVWVVLTLIAEFGVQKYRDKICSV